MVGDTARAESLAQNLDKRYPLDTQMQALWLPAIRAQLALNRRDAALALNTLQAASAIEFGNIAFAADIHVCIRLTFAARPTLRPVRAKKLSANSRRSSITVALSGIAGRGHWRI